MKANIPTSIRKRMLRERILRVGAFVIILTITVLLFMYFSPLSELKGLNKTLTFGLCFILNVILTGVPFKLICRSWQGEVVGIKVRTSTDSTSPIKPTNETRYTANTVVLRLKTSDGKTLCAEAEKERMRYSLSNIERYQLGDYVARIYGVNYIAHYQRKTNQIRCVLCGNYSLAESQSCKHCGGDLVQFTTEKEFE